jgi:UDP-glucose 4-epimerase
MTSRTLVIGGAGLIGSHLVPHLVKTGRAVTVLGRRSTPINPIEANVSYLSGDINDRGTIRKLLGVHDEIIHLAYATVPNTSFENPLEDLIQNLPSTVYLFEEAAKFGCRLLLVSSGGTVYGQAKSLPISESHPTEPISPYGVTKLTLENYSKLYAVTHGLRVVCVRPANAYGIGQLPFTGQGFVATVIASLLQRKTITIFGEQGTVRDYIYVDDIATGLLKALQHGQPGETYNLGSGIGSSNLEIIDTVIPMLNLRKQDCIIKFEASRIFDVQANVLDCTKLRSETGWVPEMKLRDGLARTIDWLRERI